MKMILKYMRKIFLLYSKTYGFFSSFLHKTPFAFPSKVTFKITNICNVDCHFCFNAPMNISSERKLEIDLDDWKKVVDSIPFHTAISFTGGEAFLYPKIFELISYIDQKNRKASVVSNGTTLKEENLQQIVNSKLHYMMFSLHGMERTHNRILGGQINYFEKTTNAIKRINEIKKERKSNKPIVGIKVVITDENYHDIPALMKYCENELGVSHLYFNLLTNEPFEVFNELEDAFKRKMPIHKYSKDKIEPLLELIEFIFKYKKTSKMDIGFTSEFSSKKMLKKFIENPDNFYVDSCNRPFHEIYIQPNGDITLCLKYKITNLQDINYDLKNLYKIEKYQNLLNVFKTKGKKTDYCSACMEAPFKLKNA